MSFLDSLNWRSAIKSFDKTKKVSEKDLNKILTAVQMAPSSYGLQPYYVRVIKDDAIRKKLQEAGYGQDQFISSSEVLVFVRRTNLVKKIDEYISAMAGENPEARVKLKAFEDMLLGFAKSKDEAALNHWTARQVYIGLGFALAACAELKIDSCPMEGFAPEKFDEILGLPKDEHATVVMTVGYRNPAVAPPPKFRMPLNQIVKM
jgi:nitroreductase/dihydropteridine reductase